MLDEVSSFRENNTLFSYMYPAQNEDIVKQLAARKATVFGMECVPRISRAQVFDALSSMANISGYKAVVLAANNFGRFFTGAFVANNYRHCFNFYQKEVSVVSWYSRKEVILYKLKMYRNTDYSKPVSDLLIMSQVR